LEKLGLPQEHTKNIVALMETKLVVFEDLQKKLPFVVPLGRFNPFIGHEGPYERRGIVLLYFRPLH